ncbi:hypothetical protein HAX54_015897 [Datura stramonium]|uniref:Uncharacterized protein n=1 Tax=Datura stramonium TaxID=4076 RepID=A0ABS8UK86_DATST|nr:hypothetical protein [Datura stramonium]
MILSNRSIEPANQIHRGAAGSPGLGESGAGWLRSASELPGELLLNKLVKLKPLPPAPSPNPEPEAPEGAIMLHDSEIKNLRDHAIARASASEHPNPLRERERAFPPRDKSSLPSSAKAEGSLTARPTRRAGTKLDLSDPMPIFFKGVHHIIRKIDLVEKSMSYSITLRER